MSVTITCTKCSASVTDEVEPAAAWDKGHQRLHDQAWVLKQITPPIHDIYGRGVMAKNLAAYLAQHIAESKGVDSRWIMQTCWDWFPGGDTAKVVSTEIVERLTSEIPE